MQREVPQGLAPRQVQASREWFLMSHHRRYPALRTAQPASRGGTHWATISINPCLSPPHPIPAPSDGAGSAKGERRSNLGAPGHLLDSEMNLPRTPPQ
uniref:Uncharacterized protein n=1 Tax=Plectus sambesii TaxID=2011161 RepID=A0A914XGP3_9BILA